MTSAHVSWPLLDAVVAREVTGLTEGVDFGWWEHHDWQRTASGEIDRDACQDDEGQDSVRCLRCHDVEWLGYGGQPVPDESCVIEPEPYSTDRRVAMTLLDSWRGDWEVRRQNDQYKVTLYEPSMQGDEWDASLPLAICRIRLRAVRW